MFRFMKSDTCQEKESSITVGQKYVPLLHDNKKREFLQELSFSVGTIGLEPMTSAM